MKLSKKLTQPEIQEKVSRLDWNRLARECAKLDKAFEQALADEGLASEVTEELSAVIEGLNEIIGA